jgi:hypothetical protein
MADASGSRLNIGAPVEPAALAVARTRLPPQLWWHHLLLRWSGTPAVRPGVKIRSRCHPLHQVQVLLLWMLLLPESIPFSALPARSAVRFSTYRWNSPSLWMGENCENRFFMNTLGRNSLWGGGLVWRRRWVVLQGRLVVVCGGSRPPSRLFHDFWLPHRHVKVRHENLWRHLVPEGVRSRSAFSLVSLYVISFPSCSSSYYL